MADPTGPQEIRTEIRSAVTLAHASRIASLHHQGIKVPNIIDGRSGVLATRMRPARRRAMDHYRDDVRAILGCLDSARCAERL
jgi:hypothetical protein